MKFTTLLVVSFLSLLIFTPLVSAANPNYTVVMGQDDVLRSNQSIIHDPTEKAMPFDVWVMAGVIGLILMLLALGIHIVAVSSPSPITAKMDYEVAIIISVMAWPFCWGFAWGCLTTVDRIVGVVMSTSGGTSVVVTQHILYSFWWLGIAAVGGSVFAIVSTILLIAQFKFFKSESSKDKINPETK
jgi:hypothetical protein